MRPPSPVHARSKSRHGERPEERKTPMTQVTRRELMPGVWLRAIHTDKFKSSY